MRCAQVVAGGDADLPEEAKQTYKELFENQSDNEWNAELGSESGGSDAAGEGASYMGDMDNAGIRGLIDGDGFNPRDVDSWHNKCACVTLRHLNSSSVRMSRTGSGHQLEVIDLGSFTISSAQKTVLVLQSLTFAISACMICCHKQLDCNMLEPGWSLSGMPSLSLYIVKTRAEAEPSDMVRQVCAAL